ncbi:hypothetical protein L2E82_47648 [Cichorium intybus]|uniref:Uncharacterized protein n=1 Tax=Cichorium intybus TaxID=13427 RepID=A0ACB8YWB9_CICIN|nr:hypothetical protein L2E82_47648 [Cichorium intybus]
MEDTDEDFFDKLVDDVDDQFKITSSSSTKGIVNNSNEAKANSSIDNGRNALKESDKVSTEANKASSTISSGLIHELTSNQVNPGQSLVSSSSFAYHTVNEDPNNMIRMETQFDSTTSQYQGTVIASGVKEVQWSSFTSEPLKNTNNTFGSYSDFFTEFGDNPVHQSKVDNFSNNVSNSNNDNSHQFQQGQSYTTSTDGQDLNTTQYWENLYPGWKYDTNTGQWYQVDESYDTTTSTQANEVAYLNQTSQLMAEKGTNESVTNWSQVSQTNETPSQGNNNGYPSHMYFDPQYPGWYYDMNIQEWRSLDSYNSQATANTENNSYYGNEQQGYQHVQNQYNSASFPVDKNVNQQQSYDYGNFNQSTTMEQSDMMNGGKGYGSQNQLTYSQQSVHHKRSSAGQPPHALVTFGFGGKLIVMKDTSAVMNTSYGRQDSSIGPISVLNIAEIVTGGGDVARGGARVCGYFNTLCRQSFPGPLTGGNVGGKELNRWIDERITHTADVDYKKDQVLKLLLSLLKIASQHYGKLRSPYGTDTTSNENDGPDVAVARLFASVKRDSTQYGFANCLQQLPAEGQIRATAAEVQTLLIYGRKIEALQRAQEGQLWGLALVLAAQLGDQYYVDCVRKMGIHQLVAGSPLRTLCLLIAGQPADVFSTTDNGNPVSVNMFQQAEVGANAMLNDWEENLAMITANRTKDDELVLIHLGDCLWKETSNIIAAHICYLVAEANFEPYSDSARLCLIGADHWKHPRTYASPQAIQRTEVYEYSKLLGNSQFTLLPFQPYKLIYANMLAEVGRVSDSLKYCQVISRSLKTGRAPEVETWRHLVTSLEDRIKTHQQGGFSTNLAPGKLVGKLLNLFDSTAHRVVGGLPPPVPSTSGSVSQSEHHQQPAWPRVSASQSTMAMSSLIPSASNENSTQGNNRRIMHNRSVSEPDFGRSPRQDVVHSRKEENSGDSQTKTSLSSRFGRFGFGSQLFQKTFSLVLKPRQDKQAKLGETNKFYYDDKLKRWVEEGVDPPAEEKALAPPPTTAAFQNGTPDYAAKSEHPHALSNGSSEFSTGTAAAASVGHSSGIPPIPGSSSSQFSSRGRMGVRARYVDTFNQGGGGNPQTKSFQPPSTVSTKPITKSNPKFFVPVAVRSSQQQPTDTLQKPTTIDEDESPPFQTPTYQSSIQRFGSMDNLGKGGMPVFPSDTCSPRSRRTVSWGGSMDQRFCNQRGQNEEVFGTPRSSFVPSGPQSAGFMNNNLHEVEL